ncbi:MAG: cell division protein FtsQ/DivIB [Thiopseudomonas sp.]|nr:cell division protein FtsQ/DivIB [Gammaproteobacteria bacterium]
MAIRGGNQAHSTRQASAARRGASRIAPPPAPKKRQWQAPRINWRLLGRFVFSLLAVAGLGAAFQAWQVMQPELDRPISQVLVEGKLGEVAAHNRVELQQQLEAFGEIRFFSADLAAMQQALEALPWVDQARISRIWPGQLKVEVVEQQPIARWGESQWLNSRGQVFRGITSAPAGEMPSLLGPDGSEARVMQQYWNLTRILRPLGYSIARLELRARGSWFVTTSDGLELWLGRDEILEKMRRFTAIYERELKEQIKQVARVDLRYANGLAVAWHDNDSEAAVH